VDRRKREVEGGEGGCLLASLNERARGLVFIERVKDRWKERIVIVEFVERGG